MSHHGPNPFDGNEHLRKLMEDVGDVGRYEDQRQELIKKTLLEPDQDARKSALSRALLETTNMVGSTGLHPKGKLTPSDEGGIQFRVGSEGDKVVLDFGTPVHWVGMSAQEAAELASSLMKWARIVGRKNGETITLNLSAV